MTEDVIARLAEIEQYWQQSTGKEWLADIQDDTEWLLALVRRLNEENERLRRNPAGQSWAGNSPYAKRYPL